MRRSLIAVVVAVAVAVGGATPAVAASGAGSSRPWTDAERRAHGMALRTTADDAQLVSSRAVAAVPATLDAVQDASIAAPRWPQAGEARLRTRAGRVVSAEPGGLRLQVAEVGEETGLDRAAVADPAGVDVQVLDRDAAEAVGVDGVVMRVEVPDGQPVEISVGYEDFAGAYGGDWSSRLRWVQLPACAVTDPQDAQCRTQVPVSGSVNDSQAQTVTAQVAPSSGAVLALSAGTSGGAGDWSATPLSASSSWQVNNQTGAFTWSYPFTAPVTAGGPAPSMVLSYDAASLDGRISTTNNQSSWIGDGWNMDAGYVERRYSSCSEDASGNANNLAHPTGDLCWNSDNATLVLAGHSADLVKDAATGTWRLEEDDGTVVRHLVGGWNGDNDTEYWQVTTTDGTQYWFGRDKRSATDTLALNSAWTVPVYGNNPGEPCYAASFAASVCTQAWRWNLDYVVDTSGNSMTFVYAKETNFYGRNDNSAVSSYVRGGYLTRIDYGQRQGSESSASAPQQMSFQVSERCIPSGSVTCDPGELTASTAASWPDVPFDLICSSSSSCPNLTSPAFFTRKRLTGVSTAVFTSGAYRPVDSWQLEQKFPSPGDGANPVLWLKSVQHTGSAPGASVTLPTVTFNGTQLTNRVDASGNLGPAMIRWRISSIVAETGAVTSINYTPTDCTTASLPTSADANTRRCFPVVWSPEGSIGPVTEYFHKYLVSSVVQNSLDAQSLPVETRYVYGGTPAWHYDDSPLTPTAQRTWGQFRGYELVDVYTGATTSAQLHTQYKYFRGMNGDRLAAGGTKAASIEGIVDVNRLNGYQREQVTFDGAAVVDRTVSTPWVSAPTATGADGSAATFLGTASTDVRTAAAALPGGAMVARTSTTYDPVYGMATQIEDAGDVATSTDDRCTRLTYARNTGANIVATVSRAETVSVACSATPSRPGQVIADERTLYDSGVFGAAPTKGLVTASQELTGYSGSTPTYLTTSSATYDANGRTLTSTDALGNVTTTSYTPATGGPTTAVTVTSPDPDGAGPTTAHQVTTALDPARGLVTSVTDPNGKVTTATYDGLGRRTAVWLPGRSLSAGATTTYAYTVADGGRSTVTTKTLAQDGSYLTSVDIFDAMDRPRQSQTQGANRSSDTILVSDTAYDSRGLAVTVTDAWATAGAPSTTLLQPATAVPSRTRYTYDGAGRVTAAAYDVDQQEKWVTTTTYAGDRTTVVPPAGATPTKTIIDARGRTTSLIRYTTTSLSGPSQTSTFAYDPAGRLVSTKDSAGNTWTSTYDLRGRLVSTSDPDKGTTTSTFDDADRTVSTTDARGTTLWFGYDALGRKTQQRLGSSTGSLLATWTYDTLARGQLTSSTSYSGSNAYVSAITGYDDAYQPTGQSLTLPTAEGALAGTYTTSYGYTLDEQVKTQTMPALANLPAETVTTYYDKLSLPEWSTGGLGKGVYVAGSTYSSFGDLLSMDLGNSNSNYLTYTYEQGTRRLSTQTLQRETVTGNDLALSYTYDNAGNVTKISDNPTVAATTTDTQCFTYDGLQRLTTTWTPSSGNCVQAPTVSGMGGAAPYWVDYTYDAAGDRVSSLTHAGAGNTTATYTYPAAGSVRVHGLTKVTSTGPAGTSTSTYGYDAAGNTTSRAVAGQAAQTLSWDAQGRLASVSANSTQVEANVYSADGTRVLRRTPGKVTAYLPGGQELTLDTATGTTSATRYYSFAGRTVAVRTATGLAGVATLIADAQGTALVAVANGNNALTRRWTDAFGAARGSATGAWSGDHGFLNKVTDATTGLVAVGARFYDATIGRFISVDPVMDRSNPQQWTGYAYSENNPATWADPTGMLSWGSAWKAVKRTGAAAGRWVQQHQSQIAGAVAGIVVTAGCLAATGGAGSIACAAAGGAAASAVTNLWAAKIAHTTKFSARSLLIDIAVGATIGAVTGAAGKIAATTLSKAGSSLARTAITDAKNAIRTTTTRLSQNASNTAKTAMGSPSKAITRLTPQTAANTGDDLVRVGRWMSEDEFAKMSSSGRVVEGGSGRTYVTRPANPDAYPAGKGVFAEFDVPGGSVFPASKPEWGVIPGPNVTTTRFGPPPAEMPPATCIVLVCRR